MLESIDTTKLQRPDTITLQLGLTGQNVLAVWMAL